LGRKNYLFCGSDGGGESAAAIYTLLGTARLNGVDPERWLRGVLARIADRPLSRIVELLPWNTAADLSGEHCCRGDIGGESGQVVARDNYHLQKKLGSILWFLRLPERRSMNIVISIRIGFG